MADKYSKTVQIAYTRISQRYKLLRPVYQIDTTQQKK